MSARVQLYPGPMDCLLLQSAAMQADSNSNFVANYCNMTDGS